MGFKSLFRKQESLVAVDVGTTGVRLLELSLPTPSSKPIIRQLGMIALSGEIFSNNIITQQEKVADSIAKLLDVNGIDGKRAVTCVPAPTTFMKKIKVPQMDGSELRSHIQFEAANFLPGSSNNVRIDFQVLGEVGKNQLDVLVVAAKGEVVDSFVETFGMAGLDVAIVDVEHLAIQNMFEACYAEYLDKTVAIINIGFRYSSVSICRNGNSLFTGDISIGGKGVTLAIAEASGLSLEEAESAKKIKDSKNPAHATVQEYLDIHVDHLSSELNRQLSFFWNSVGSEEGLEKIFLTGGGGLVEGLVEELAEKTGVECMRIDPFRGFDIGEGVQEEQLQAWKPFFGVCAGLGVRYIGDRVH